MSLLVDNDILLDLHETQSEDGEQDTTLSMRDRRVVIFHMLYAMDSFDYDASVESVAENVSRALGIDIGQTSEFFTTGSAIVKQRIALDNEFKPLLDNWRYDRVGVCTRLILRLAVWEMLNTDTDYKIIINEAIELTKAFAEQDAYKFVNGVLDEWVKRNRSVVPA